MTSAAAPESYLDHDVVDPEGNKIGSVGQVYLNDDTGTPDWITVNTGLFGMRENFVPLAGSRLDGHDLVVPFTKDVIKDAPQIDDASHLEVSEQRSLHEYYRQHLGQGEPDRSQTIPSGQDAAGAPADIAPESAAPDSAGPVATDVDHPATGIDAGSSGMTDSDASAGPATMDTYADGRGTSGPSLSTATADDAMTRSEEQLRVGTEQVESGRARLRKYIVTEQQTVTVPVSHEEVRIVREPITDADRGDAADGTVLAEQEHEIVLHAERPVVTTEAVAVERVRIGTETITEDEQVTGEVRKEAIELGGGDTVGAGEPVDHSQDR